MQNTRRKEGKVMLKPVVKASEFTKYGLAKEKTDTLYQEWI